MLREDISAIFSTCAVAGVLYTSVNSIVPQHGMLPQAYVLVQRWRIIKKKCCIPLAVGSFRKGLSGVYVILVASPGVAQGGIPGCNALAPSNGFFGGRCGVVGGVYSCCMASCSFACLACMGVCVGAVGARAGHGGSRGIGGAGSTRRGSISILKRNIQLC